MDKSNNTFLILGVVSLISFLLAIFSLLFVINKAEDKTARKHWARAFLPNGIILILLIILYLSSSASTNSNTIAGVFICIPPILLMTGLIYFNRRAPWFWKNRQIFKNDVVNKELIRSNKSKK
jgi:uncharacterized membrane protein YjdF